MKTQIQLFRWRVDPSGTNKYLQNHHSRSREITTNHFTGQLDNDWPDVSIDIKARLIHRLSLSQSMKENIGT